MASYYHTRLLPRPFGKNDLGTKLYTVTGKGKLSNILGDAKSKELNSSSSNHVHLCSESSISRRISVYQHKIYFQLCISVNLHQSGSQFPCYSFLHIQVTRVLQTIGVIWLETVTNIMQVCYFSAQQLHIVIVVYALSLSSVFEQWYVVSAIKLKFSRYVP